MKIRTTCISILIILFAFQTTAQSVIALSSGISTDLNNKRPFYMVPVTLRWEPFKWSSFFIQATKGIAFKRISHADAYTIIPQLPEHVVLTEAINLQTFSLDLGGAIVLYTNKKNNRITLNLSAGVCTEYFRINYRNYDTANYEVLNPDVNEILSGLYASVACLYSFHKRKRDMFIMLRLQSNSSGGIPDRYTLSYDKTSPLQLTFGYNLFYNKKRNEHDGKRFREGIIHKRPF